MRETSPARPTSLRSFLLLNFLLISVVPVILVSVVFLVYSYRAVLSQTRLLISQTNFSLEVVLSGFINQHKSFIEGTARESMLDDWTVAIAHGQAGDSYAALDAYIRPLLNERRTETSEIFLLGADDGRVIYSTDKIEEGKFKDTSRYFAGGKRAAYFQSIFYSPSQQAMSLVVSAPVRNPAGQTVGVLCERLVIESLKRKLESGTRMNKKTVVSYLVNQSHQFVSTAPIGGATYAHTVFASYVDDAVSGNSGDGIFPGPSGEVVCSYTWLPSARVALVTQVDLTDVLARVADVLKPFVALLLALIGFAWLYGHYWTLRLRRPLTDLSDACEYISGGHLGVSLKLSSFRELNLLAGTITKMSSDLATSFEEKTALNTQLTSVNEDLKSRNEELLSVGRKLQEKNIELEESERKQREIIDLSPVIFLQSSREGTLLYCNEAFSRVLGYVPEEALGMNLTSLQVNRDSEPHFVEEVTRQGFISNFLLTLKAKTGKPVYLAASMRAVRNAEGQVMFVEGFAIDVSESQGLQKQLEDSYQRYYRSIEESPLGFVRINEDARIMDVNRKSCEITGYNREELLMMSFASLCSVPEEFRVYLDGVRQSGGGDSKPTVMECRRKNGSVCYVELEMRRTVEAGGGPAQYESFLKDITDAHILQEKVRDSERRYREIVETSPAAFARLGLDGRITMVNPAFSAITCYTEDELKAINPDKLYANPSERDLFNNRLIEKGEITNYTIKLRRKDGSPLIVMESARAVPDASPEGMHFIMFAVDITEQAELSDRLRRSEQKFREIIEQSPVGFCHLDANYGILTVNSALCDMTGYTSVELMGASFSSLFTSYEAMRACASTTEKNRIVKNLVVNLKKKNGTPIYVSMTARVLEGGSTAMTELFLVDITERYVLEMQLRESEERYRSLFEDSQDGLYSLDPATGYFSMYNRRFCEILGYTQEEFANVTIADITHPDYIATARYERDKRVSGKDIAVPYRTTFIRKDGKRIIVDVMARPLEHTNFITGSVRDITFQVDLESEILRRRDELAKLNANLERLVQERTHQLTEMQRFNEKVVNTAPVGVIALDTKGNVTFVNEFLKRKLLLGSLEGGKKPSVLEAGTLLPSSYSDLLSRCLKGDAFELSDIAYRPPHGDEDVFLNIKGVPLLGECAEIEGALLVVEDMTERVGLREKLISSARLAATGRLAANVAHEINNPLNSIRYNLDLITLELEQAAKSKGKSLDEVKSYVEKVDAEIVRIARIVNNLLDLHRPEVKFVQNVDANKAVSETMELMEKQVEEAKVKLVLKLADGLPPVSAVHAQLKQVILNIILNAIQAMPDGGTLTIETKRAGDHVNIAVADTGVGISRKDRRYVFEPFFTTKGVQGTGIGLSISYSIIKAYGGDITVKTEEGKGSCFTVQLPARHKKA